MDALLIDGSAGIAGLCLAALGVGALHALDADHVMAVSGLASRRTTLRASLRIAGRWALGHGATLLGLGTLAWWIGSALPEGFPLLAERLVAVLLCAIGLRVLADLYGRGARLRVHRHPGMRPHIHWVLSDTNHERQGGTSNEHGAVLVGVLHGAAGSAPMLALAAAGAQGSLLLTLTIVLSFSLGVLTMMLLFGGILGRLVEREEPLAWLRAVAGSGSILLGGSILLSTL
jgi:cytochrome c biogenesis protein CcdA